MDKQQARNLIKETFENPFDKTRFIIFIKNLLNRIEGASFTYQGQFIPDAYKPYISVLERIGKYSDGEHKIDILVIRLKKETSLERARTMQRNFVAWYLNGSRGGELKDAALVAFIAPDETEWRFSLVKMDYKFEQGLTGKIKVKEEFTPARRWSFLVGVNEKSHTAQSRLVPILSDDVRNPSLAQLEEAFNIETVTKEFFLKYRDLFIRIKEALDRIVENDARIKADFKAKGVDTVNFTKKLLGQIVFLYFLQKKGWFGVERDAEWGTGSKHFLRELFKGRHGKYVNFFNDILEPLFYEALRIDRRHDDDYYSRFDCKIPFLNGGLFDPINNYDWVHTDIHLPNELFSNSLRTKEGDTGDGILDIFDRYNFTVREDEPLEKEVAVDPEMLGKVFENLLEVKDRKSKGTYYTPREIVHYMCQESLINYLDTTLNTGSESIIKANPVQQKLIGKPDPEQLGLSSSAYKPSVPRNDIEEFIGKGETTIQNDLRVMNEGRETRGYSYRLPESIRKNARWIDEALSSIKICDPAVGSGAFSVGMMQEIVKAREVLTTHILRAGLEPAPTTVGADSKSAPADHRTAYNFKRHCIQESIYGVDIDPSAVDIAKLRLWLSLVVDEEDYQKIKPLPNLDYKIVCGNSLLGAEKDLLNHKLFKELESLKPQFFEETNPGKKKALKDKIDSLIKQITNNDEHFDFEVYFSEVFHAGKGFDVIIGNPPYQGFQTLPKSLKVILEGKFQSATGKFDLYIPFIERSFQILRDNGYFVFICPTSFSKRGYGRDIRSFLIKNVKICELVDFEHDQMFDHATNYTGIFSFIKSKLVQNKFIYKTGFDGTSIILNQSELSESPWVFINPKVEHVVHKLKKNILLGEIGKISEGVVTGLNDIYLKTKEQIAKSKYECDFFFPTYRGKEIDRYYLKPYSELLFYPYTILNDRTVPIEENTLLRKAPKYMNYLRSNIDLINRREYFTRSSKKWYELWNQRDISIFKSPKILTPELSERNRFMIAEPDIFFGDTVCGITPKGRYQEEISLKYLLSILNSSLIEWFYKKTTVPKAGGFFIYKVMFLSNIPIIIISPDEQKPSINLVNKILSITKDNDYLHNSQKQAKVKEYERQVDQMVYELYGLTPEEIAIVEGRKN